MRRLVTTIAVLAVVAWPAAAQADPPSWTTSIAPSAPHRAPAALHDVACPSTTFCIGVADGPPAVVEVRDGVATARALSLPIDAGNVSYAALAAIACSTPHWCVAVGSYVTYTQRQRPLFETFRNGAWEATTAPSSAHSLSGVACNRRTCLATGNWYGGYYDDTVLFRRDVSGTWIQSSFGVTYGDTIADPACTPNVGPCYAQVFHQAYAFPDDRMFVYPSPSGWKAVNFPGPPDADLTTLQLGTMSCPAVKYCVAVGSYRDTTSAQAQHLVAEEFADGELSATEIPLPAAVAGDQGDLLPTDTACSDRRHCVAGASFHTFLRYRDGLLVSRAGPGWTAETAPVPGGTDPSAVSIAGVTCSAVGFCAAVGSIGYGGGRRAALAEIRSHGAWHPTLVPMPNGHTTGVLNGVSCVAVTCTAVGSSDGDPLLAVRG